MSQLLPSVQLVGKVPDTKRTFVQSPLLWIWLSKEEGAGRGSFQKEFCNSGLWQAHYLNSIPSFHNHVTVLLASSRAQTLVSRASLSWAQLHWHLTVPGTPYDASAVWLSFRLVLWVLVSLSERKGINQVLQNITIY